MELLEALQKIRSDAQADAFNDTPWVSNGDVRLETLKDMLGRDVSRKEVVDLAPSFSRSTLVLPGDSPVENDDTVTPPDGASPPVAEGGLPEVDPPSTDGPLQGGAVASGPTLEDFLEFQDELNDIQFQNLIRNMEVEELDRLRDYLTDQSDQANQAQNKLAELIQANKFRTSLVKNLANAQRPEMTNQEAIRAYLDSQQKERASRFAVVKEVKRMLAGRPVDPRSVIDRAFARKTTRGGQRTAHPVRRLGQ